MCVCVTARTPSLIRYIYVILKSKQKRNVFTNVHSKCDERAYKRLYMNVCFHIHISFWFIRTTLNIFTCLDLCVITCISVCIYHTIIILNLWIQIIFSMWV